MCQDSSQPMDHPFHSPSAHHLRQRGTVHICSVESNGEAPGGRGGWVKIHHTTAYYPQSNRLVETFHRHLKASLMARLSGPDWADKLPRVLIGIRTAPKEDLQASAAEMVYGAPLSLLGEFFGPDPDTTATVKNLLADLRRQLASLAHPSPQHAMGPSHFISLKSSTWPSSFSCGGDHKVHRYNDRTRGYTNSCTDPAEPSPWMLAIERNFLRWTA
ncbi:uncharacterized protein [Narcine bancroftii]|uniref:uncharacterized protein n=1 Tax=Narcine bancroftii TaxID=1343680 RepID=UPI003831C8F0